MSRLLDTNVLVRHFSGSPPDQAAAATALLKSSAPRDLFLTDVHVAEFVWVLESSFYRADRKTVKAALEATLALPAIEVANEAMLRDALSLYSRRSMHWTDAYLIASARSAHATEVMSFDRFDAKLVGLGVRRLEPGRR